MDNYNYHKGMKGIIQELKVLLKTKSIGTNSDRALLLDFQAALETKPEKAIKLEKDALAQIETITADNTQSGLQRLEICRSTAGILFEQFPPILTISCFRKINQQFSQCHDINFFFHFLVPLQSRYNVFYLTGRKIIQPQSQSTVHLESS